MPFDPTLLLSLLRSKWLYMGLLLAALSIQTARMHHAHVEVQTLTRTYQAAQQEAQTKALAAKQQTEQKYADNARAADSSLQSRQRMLDTAADTYVAHHRLHIAQSAASPTSPASESSSAPIPESLPTDAVVVTSNDVRQCTDAVNYGIQAHDWAATLNDDK